MDGGGTGLRRGVSLQTHPASGAVDRPDVVGTEGEAADRGALELHRRDVTEHPDVVRNGQRDTDRRPGLTIEVPVFEAVDAVWAAVVEAGAAHADPDVVRRHRPDPPHG